MTMSVNKKSKCSFLLYFRNAEIQFLYLFRQFDVFSFFRLEKDHFSCPENKAISGWSKGITTFGKTLLVNFFSGNCNCGTPGTYSGLPVSDCYTFLPGIFPGYSGLFVTEILRPNYGPERNSFFHPKLLGFPGTRLNFFFPDSEVPGFFRDRVSEEEKPGFVFPPGKWKIFSGKIYCAGWDFLVRKTFRRLVLWNF